MVEQTGSGIFKIYLANSKITFSPSMSLIEGITYLTSEKRANCSNIGIKCSSSRSFLSSYHELQGRAFSGWNNELKGELSTIITSLRGRPSLDRSFT